jgi:hypothetical protein
VSVHLYNKLCNLFFHPPHLEKRTLSKKTCELTHIPLTY